MARDSMASMAANRMLPSWDALTAPCLAWMPPAWAVPWIWFTPSTNCSTAPAVPVLATVVPPGGGAGDGDGGLDAPAGRAGAAGAAGVLPLPLAGLEAGRRANGTATAS